MRKRILIIHGWESNSREHFFLKEKERLEKLGHEVYVPDMPNAFFPKKEEWIRVIEDFNPDTNSILIGHSLGGTAILRYLETAKSKIKRCILVATPIKKIGFEATDNFFEPDFNWQNIKQNCEEIFILNQKDDPWVPLQCGKDLSKNVDGKLIEVEGNNHFDTIDFSLIEEHI